MKRNIYIFLAAFMFFMSSCENSLEELNVDPTTVSGVDLRLVMPDIQVQTMFNEGAAGSRAAGIVLQQFIGLDAQQLDYTQYIFGEDLLNNYWRFGLYAGVLRSCDVMIKQAQTEGEPFYEGVAKVIMAHQYGIATSWFGDIPFSEALKGSENLKPSYDAQENVYEGVIAMLDDAIAILSNSGDAVGTNDLIYDGNAALWVKTAKGLKARYLLHQAKRNPGNMSTVLSLVGESYSSNAEQSNFTFGSSTTNNYSLAKFGIDRPGTLGIDPRFAAMMDGDPRQAVYMYQSDEGVWLYHNGANFYSKNDATIPLLSYAELKFMEAEATMATGGSADAALKAAIMANFDQLGLDGEAYADAVVAGGVDMTTILTEAYKAYYGYNFSTTFANYRRTGVPALVPHPNGVNGANPSGIVPRRFLYAESESATNRVNLDAAKARQSGALLDVDVWAFE